MTAVAPNAPDILSAEHDRDPEIAYRYLREHAPAVFQPGSNSWPPRPCSVASGPSARWAASASPSSRRDQRGRPRYGTAGRSGEPCAVRRMMICVLRANEPLVLAL